MQNAETAKCQYIFKRGRQEGQSCTVKAKEGCNGYCTKHFKLIEKGNNNGASKSEEIPVTAPSTPRMKVISPMKPEEQPKRIYIPPKKETPPPPETEVLVMPAIGDDEEDQYSSSVEMDDQFGSEIDAELEGIVKNMESWQGENRKELINDDERLEKKILFYYRRFPWLANELPIEQRGDRSASEWHDAIRELLVERASSGLITMVFDGSTKVIELVGVNQGFKLQGYSHLMSPNSNNEVKQILDELLVDYSETVKEYCTPEFRLLGVLFAGALKVHEINSMPSRTSDNNSPKRT